MQVMQFVALSHVSYMNRPKPFNTLMNSEILFESRREKKKERKPRGLSHSTGSTIDSSTINRTFRENSSYLDF